MNALIGGTLGLVVGVVVVVVTYPLMDRSSTATLSERFGWVLDGFRSLFR